MRNVIIAVIAVLAVAVVSFAGNVHRDGTGALMPDIFTPTKTTSLTHTKADVRYTPSNDATVIRINPSAAVYYKLSSARNKKDTAGFPIAANATDKIGIASINGVGVNVQKIIFSGSSSAAKTIYIQEQ